MRRFIMSSSDRLSTWMEVVAGLALTGVMLLIVADIAGRAFGFPVPGAYEMVSLAGGLIIGMALPATSRAKSHVCTDILIARLSRTTRNAIRACTRFIGLGLFLIAGFGMIWMGFRLKASGEVTAVLSFPFYYATFAIGGAFAIQALVLLSEILRMSGEGFGREGQGDE
jgi:TRAP-type C4-dicarboxylate transport system permease small subunit